MKSSSSIFTSKRLLRPITFAFFALALNTSVSADSIESGKSKATSCAVCHGMNGISQMPGAPNLAGQQAVYTSEQLKNFRSGKRSNEIMNVIAKPLSDADIADLSAWFESIKPDSTKTESTKAESTKPESAKPESMKHKSIKPKSMKPESKAG